MTALSNFELNVLLAPQREAVYQWHLHRGFRVDGPRPPPFLATPGGVVGGQAAAEARAAAFGGSGNNVTVEFVSLDAVEAEARAALAAGASHSGSSAPAAAAGGSSKSAGGSGAAGTKSCAAHVSGGGIGGAVLRVPIPLPFSLDTQRYAEGELAGRVSPDKLDSAYDGSPMTVLPQKLTASKAGELLQTLDAVIAAAPQLLSRRDVLAVLQAVRLLLLAGLHMRAGAIEGRGSTPAGGAALAAQLEPVDTQLQAERCKLPVWGDAGGGGCDGPPDADAAAVGQRAAAAAAFARAAAESALVEDQRATAGAELASAVKAALAGRLARDGGGGSGDNPLLIDVLGDGEECGGGGGSGSMEPAATHDAAPPPAAGADEAMTVAPPTLPLAGDDPDDPICLSD